MHLSQTIYAEDVALRAVVLNLFRMATHILKKKIGDPSRLSKPQKNGLITCFFDNSADKKLKSKV
jgi:hypothetical protein